MQVSPCDSGLCENGGECLNVGDSFECKCPSGYSGKRCENKGMKKIDFFLNHTIGILMAENISHIT